MPIPTQTKTAMIWIREYIRTGHVRRKSSRHVFGQAGSGINEKCRRSYIPFNHFNFTILTIFTNSSVNFSACRLVQNRS
jgi:hypothetical protein